MKEYEGLYHIYYYPLFFLIRILLIIFFIINSYLLYANNQPFFQYISLSSIFLIFEIFFYFKVAKKIPIVPISENKADLSDSFTLSALNIFSSHSSKDLFKKLLKDEEIEFFLEKANIKNQEIVVVDIDKISLENKSRETVIKRKGVFIQGYDLLFSYIIMTDWGKKLMIEKNLDEADLINILKWTSLNFPEDKSNKIIFWGNGIADDWVFGWISETKKYMLDLTSQVLRKKRFFYPREKEYKLMLGFLYSFKSVILVGNPGSGKDALVEQFIADSFNGNLEKNLNHVKVLQFLADEFLAGAQNQGEVEKRFSSIIMELSHAKDVIIFIENIETVLGSSDFNLDLSSALIPYLKDSKLRIIGTTTPQMYKQFVENRLSFIDLVSVIKVEDPGDIENLFIMFEKSSEIERKYNAVITYKAISASLKLGPKYLPNLSLPGSGVRLLDDVCAGGGFIKNKIIDENDIDKKVEEKTKIPQSSPTLPERTYLINLENEIHKSIIGQNEAVSAISNAIRRIRSGLVSSTKPVSFLFLGPTGVGKTQTAKAVSKIYFGGEKEIIRLDMSEYGTQEGLSKLLDSGSGGFLDKVFNNPFSLILLDEFEKSNPKVQDLFLQILDDARLTDDKGRTVNLSDTLIIATSNAGSEFIRESIGVGNILPKNFNKILIDNLLTQGIFKPELINRFDQTVVFKPLSQSEIKSVSILILEEFKKKLEVQEIYVNFDETLIDKVSKEGFDPEFGARPIRRFVQDNIENIIADKIIKGEIKKGDKLNLSIDSAGSLLIKPQ